MVKTKECFMCCDDLFLYFRLIMCSIFINCRFYLFFFCVTNYLFYLIRLEAPPAERPLVQSAENALAELDFRKSRIGLADVYAEQYSVEILGGKTKAETELDKKKEEITRLFAKIMYRLDSLCHQRLVPKPIKYKDGAVASDISAITVEDTM